MTSKMHKLLEWIKRNKLATVLLLIVLYFIARNALRITPLTGLLIGRQSVPSSYEGGAVSDVSELGIAPQSFRAPGIGGIFPPPVPGEAPPTTDVEDRLVVRETQLSLLVEDVRRTSDAIINHVDEQGGYMVNSMITQPEEAPYGTIVVRIPSEKLRGSMEYFRSLSIKVTSEFISGQDVTDEYEDIESRLATLEKTKARFEEILDQATKIDDILRVQREIINLQSQIDNLKGRQQLLEGTARLAKVTIHLSTDEIALPYTPSETFRPTVIFKLAWRSLLRNLRKLATSLIWIGVYSVIWAPIIVAVIAVKRLRSKKKPVEQ